MIKMTATDAFSVLGLPINADEREIKREYKKLALATHPDKNKAPDAEDQFKRVKEAYDTALLSIENQRLYGASARYQFSNFFDHANPSPGQTSETYSQANHNTQEFPAPESIFLEDLKKRMNIEIISRFAGLGVAFQVDALKGLVVGAGTYAVMRTALSNVDLFDPLLRSDKCSEMFLEAAVSFAFTSLIARGLANITKTDLDIPRATTPPVVEVTEKSRSSSLFQTKRTAWEIFCGKPVSS